MSPLPISLPKIELKQYFDIDELKQYFEMGSETNEMNECTKIDGFSDALCEAKAGENRRNFGGQRPEELIEEEIILDYPDNPSFDFIDDADTRLLLIDAYNGIHKNNWWKSIRYFAKPDRTRWENVKNDDIQLVIRHVVESYGHSGSSFVWTMEQMAGENGIAKNGYEWYKWYHIGLKNAEKNAEKN